MHYNETRFNIGAIQIIVPEVDRPFTDDTIVNDTPWKKFKEVIMAPGFNIADPQVSDRNLLTIMVVWLHNRVDMQTVRAQGNTSSTRKQLRAPKAKVLS